MAASILAFAVFPFLQLNRQGQRTGFSAAAVAFCISIGVIAGDHRSANDVGGAVINKGGTTTKAAKAAAATRSMVFSLMLALVLAFGKAAKHATHFPIAADPPADS
jgi:hypothetical protein